jgi:hypothetical protein
MESCEDELVASLELELYADDRGVAVEVLQLSDIESIDGIERVDMPTQAAIVVQQQKQLMYLTVTTATILIWKRIAR